MSSGPSAQAGDFLNSASTHLILKEVNELLHGTDPNRISHGLDRMRTYTSAMNEPGSLAGRIQVIVEMASVPAARQIAELLRRAGLGAATARIMLSAGTSKIPVPESMRDEVLQHLEASPR